MNENIWPEILEEAKINVATDTFEDVFKKIIDWLDSDSELVNAFVGYCVEDEIKQFVDIKDFKAGDRVYYEIKML